MLVLSRRKNETIILGDNVVRICIVDIRGDKVRIGITAPNEMACHREEVFDAIKRTEGEVKSHATGQEGT